MSYELRSICSEEYCEEGNRKCPQIGKHFDGGKWKPACLAHRTLLSRNKDNNKLYRCWMCLKLEERVTTLDPSRWEEEDIED